MYSVLHRGNSHIEDTTVYEWLGCKYVPVLNFVLVKGNWAWGTPLAFSPDANSHMKPDFPGFDAEFLEV